MGSIERLNGEVKRRTEVVGIFPNEPAMTTSTMLPLWTSNGRWCLSAHSFARATERVSTALR